MNSIKMVVFDMAGTTVDEQNVVYKTVHKAIEKHGVSVDLETVLKVGAGKEKLKAIVDVLDYINVDNVDANLVFADFKAMLDKAYDTLDVKPIEGVDITMLKLKEKGVIVVLNTGYNSRIANALVNKLNWEKGIHYDALITASDVKKGRPSSEMIDLAMEMFNITDSKVVLKAGDSAIDIEEGKNAKCGVTVGVLSGAQTKEQIEVAGPDYIIDSLATLEEEVLSK